MDRSSADTLFSAAIAGLLSIMIWLAASERQRPIDNAILAPPGGYSVEYRNVAPGYDAYVVGEPHVELRVRGITDRARGFDEVIQDAVVWVDLAGLEPITATHELPVRWSCRACTRRGVRVIEARPIALAVRFDPIVTATRTVSIAIADSSDQQVVVQERSAEPDAVLVNGPQRFVARVRNVVARVDPEAAGEEDAAFTAVLVGEDRQGTPVPKVTLMPPAAVVRLALSRSGYRLPVAPEIVGDVPAGYFWSRLLYEPSEVTVAGEVGALATLLEVGRVATEPIDLSGLTADSTFVKELRLPDGVEPLDLPTRAVTVTIQVRRQPGSRALDVPVVAVGLPPTLAFTPSPSTVRVLITGPQPVVEAMAATDLSATVDVRGLQPGRHRLAVNVTPPRELEALTITPDTIEVVLERVQGAPGAASRARPAP